MMSFLALRESAAAEADLLLHARTAQPDELMVRTQKIAGVTGDDSLSMISDIAAEPLHALAAGLSHEAWQSWYAEVGGEQRNVRAALVGTNRPANFTGHPAISVPCGFTRDKLPVGLELIGRKVDESTLLRIAFKYEREHDWSKQHPQLD